MYTRIVSGKGQLMSLPTIEQLADGFCPIISYAMLDNYIPIASSPGHSQVGLVYVRIKSSDVNLEK